MFVKNANRGLAQFVELKKRRLSNGTSYASSVVSTASANANQIQAASAVTNSILLPTTVTVKLDIKTEDSLVEGFDEPGCSQPQFQTSEILDVLTAPRNDDKKVVPEGNKYNINLTDDAQENIEDGDISLSIDNVCSEIDVIIEEILELTNNEEEEDVSKEETDSMANNEHENIEDGDVSLSIHKVCNEKEVIIEGTVELTSDDVVEEEVTSKEETDSMANNEHKSPIVLKCVTGPKLNDRKGSTPRGERHRRRTKLKV